MTVRREIHSAMPSTTTITTPTTPAITPQRRLKSTAGSNSPIAPMSSDGSTSSSEATAASAPPTTAMPSRATYSVMIARRRSRRRTPTTRSAATSYDRQRSWTTASASTPRKASTRVSTPTRRKTRQPSEKASERSSSSSSASVRLSVRLTPCLRTWSSTDCGVPAATIRWVIGMLVAWSPYSRSAAVRSDRPPLLPTMGSASARPVSSIGVRTPFTEAPLTVSGGYPLDGIQVGGLGGHDRRRHRHVGRGEPDDDRLAADLQREPVRAGVDAHG